MSDTVDAIVVGAGLAGLECARVLQKSGKSVLALEKSDAPGGRIRTDRYEGFLLDRGFQVHLTAYPYARQVLGEVQGGRFGPGALIRWGGRFHLLADPMREPLSLWATFRNPVATLGDKLKIDQWRSQALRRELASWWKQPARSTRQMLLERGFSPLAIDAFFRPYLGGILLDPSLEAPAAIAEYTFALFARGHALLPDQGMETLPRLLRRDLGTNLRVFAEVVDVGPDSVRLASGEKLSARAVVLATDGPTASRLLGARNFPEPAGRGVTCLYYSAPKSPLKGAMLMLNGELAGLINNLCVPSDVSPRYAPAGRSLVSVTVLGTPTTATLEAEVADQLGQWFGNQTKEWKHLRTYRIPFAVPAVTTVPGGKPRQSPNGIWLCGDHLAYGGIDAALLQGRDTAQAILREWAKPPPPGANRPKLVKGW